MTVRRYLELLRETFMIRLLQPWHENISKRQVKAPKLYIRDSGIFHSLLGVGARHELATHPKLGASWEAIEQTLGQAIRSEIVILEPHSRNWIWFSKNGALDTI
jgi:hypothetical protein